MSTIGLVIAVGLFLAGLAGTILPVLPGAPLILAGMIIYGLFTGFAKLNLFFFAGQALLVALTFIVDYLANRWGITRYGGSRLAVWGGAVGLLAGAFFGLAGIILGPFVGAFLGELLASGRSFHSLRVGFGSLVGFFGGTLVKILLEIGMVTWFFVTIF